MPHTSDGIDAAIAVPSLDSPGSSVLNLSVSRWEAGRALLLLLLAFAGRSAVAAPHPRPLVSVAPFSVGRALAEEEVGYFGPEVARAVAAALEADGLDVGPGAEWTVAGRIDAAESGGSDRVRLVAMARGHSVAVEGPLENVDQLAGQLASRLLPILVEGDARAGRLVGARLQPSLAARVEPSHEVASNRFPAKESPRETPKAEVAHDAPPSPAPARPSLVVVVAPTPAPTAEQPPPPKPPDPRPPDPKPVLAAPTGNYPPSGYQPWGGFVAGRVVAHAIPDPPSAYVGTGVSATQAMYGFLGRRLRLAVVPTGVGVTSPMVAADEGWRAAARSVVMSRIENLDYVPSAVGLSVRLRLQVVVVREGRVVFRRVVDSPLSDPTRRTDPIYQAVSAALEPIANELASAVASQ